MLCHNFNSSPIPSHFLHVKGICFLAAFSGHFRMVVFGCVLEFALRLQWCCTCVFFLVNTSFYSFSQLLTLPWSGKDLWESTYDIFPWIYNAMWEAGVVVLPCTKVIIVECKTRNAQKHFDTSSWTSPKRMSPKFLLLWNGFSLETLF